jgi:hypothetical protein
MLTAGGRGERCCDSSHEAAPVNDEESYVGACGAQPYLGPRTRSGDMMMDGVSDMRAANGVRPLILSGKSTQQRGGDRGGAGAGRGHQLKWQGTCATHG